MAVRSSCFARTEQAVVQLSLAAVSEEAVASLQPAHILFPAACSPNTPAEAAQGLGTSRPGSCCSPTPVHSSCQRPQWAQRQVVAQLVRQQQVRQRQRRPHDQKRRRQPCRAVPHAHAATAEAAEAQQHAFYVLPPPPPLPPLYVRLQRRTHAQLPRTRRRASRSTTRSADTRPPSLRCAGGSQRPR